MRANQINSKSVSKRYFTVVLMALFLLNGNFLRADDIENLPIEVVEALEELIPSFDPAMIASVNIASKELIHLECVAEEQLYELSLTIAGELLRMRRSFPDQEKRPFLDIQSGTDIGIRRLPQRILHALKHRFAGIIIERVQAIEQRDHRRRMFRIEAEHMGSRLDLVVKKDGIVVEFSLDSDRDGISDVDELAKGLDRHNDDTDNDGFPDGVENDFLGNPADATRIPTLLKLCHECETKVVVITAQTFRGSDFTIEVSETGKPGDWVRLGESISGDGETHDFSMPSDGACRMTMFRLGISKQEGGARVRKDGGADDSGECLVPEKLIGREIIVGDGKRLFFNKGHKGQLIEDGNNGMIVTPFSYTFRRSGHCKAKVVLTFSVRVGFQTTVYNLTFTAEGDAGIFVASEYERGNIEDRFDGTFTISMNP